MYAILPKLYTKKGSIVINENCYKHSGLQYKIDMLTNLRIVELQNPVILWGLVVPTSS